MNDIKEKGDIRASVIMPVYNGEKYLGHQLDSIIPMLADNDEIVISYDESGDDTLGVAKRYASMDNRIKVFSNECEKGVWGNSINAINHAEGKYILPSDQDDEWINDKINVLVSSMEKSGAFAATHDGYVCDENMNIIPPTIFERCHTNSSLIKNFAKNTVSGCCLIYRKDIVSNIIDAPFSPDAADQWAAIAAMMTGKLIIVDKVLIKHRIHSSNYTPKEKRKLSVIIKGRLGLAGNIAWLFINKRQRKKKIN